MERFRIVYVEGDTPEDLYNTIEFYNGVRIPRRPPPRKVAEVMADVPAQKKKPMVGLAGLVMALVEMVK